MGFLDTIDSLADGTPNSGVYTVTRRRTADATIADGIYTPDPVGTTLTITASVQPARGLPRVTGGRDMLPDEQNQHVTEALVMWTDTEVFERTPDYEPDEIVYNGRTYTIARSERWPAFGEVFWEAIQIGRAHV